MKIVIEIPETAYDAFKEWHKNKVATVEQSLIAQGIPYEERPHGEWIDTRNFPVRWTCSECGRRDTHIYKFCPDCGAKMR